VVEGVLPYCKVKTGVIGGNGIQQVQWLTQGRYVHVQVPFEPDYQQLGHLVGAERLVGIQGSVQQQQADWVRHLPYMSQHRLGYNAAVLLPFVACDTCFSEVNRCTVPQQHIFDSAKGLSFFGPRSK